MPVRREITVRRPRGRTRPLWVGALALLTVAFVSAATDAAPDRKAPRIVAAALLDTDGDYRADRIRLTYSERVQHLADADGSYPFAVAGYRIRAIARPRLRTLLLTLVEKSAADDQAKPAIRYKRTDSKPVRDRAGNQAAAEAFARVKPHGNTPPPPPPPPPPVVRDGDGDGWDDTADCAPNDRSINPGAQDLPDAGFVDSNCDGIDGDERNAVFVSPAGKDENPGTKRAPKRQVQSAILAASQTGKNVYVAAGAYVPFSAETGVGIFGGYDPATWTRQGGDPRTVIEGSPEAVLIDNERGILLQFLTLRGAAGAGTAYGIRAVNGASLTLERVQVTAAEGAAGRAAAAGSRGADGSPGAAGGEGRCDGGADVSTTWGGDGGKGGAGGGRAGGNGGNGGGVNLYGASGGSAGAVGQVVGVDGGTRGSGGGSGNPGRAGANAGPGASGASGLRGSSGTNTMALAGGLWVGDPGRTGAAAAPGGGGGGGGGGGAQTGFFVRDGPGNGGGGGGAGGAAGRPGAGGAAGGGSFGVYLHNSTIVIRSSVVTAANGGAGGRGGDAGIGGNGGLGGPGARKCTSEVGAGGNGARGGDGGTGGAGGGGAGGPSIGVMKAGTSTATLSETRVTVGTGGAGGGPGALGLGAPVGGQAGIAQAIFPAP